MMDLDLLEKGKKYRQLQKNIVIFICTFQPFVRSGRHRYFFEKRCVQEPELALKGGVTTVILSTRGTKEDIDEEMAAFLRYVEDSSEEVAGQSDSDLRRQIFLFLLIDTGGKYLKKGCCINMICSLIGRQVK